LQEEADKLRLSKTKPRGAQTDEHLSAKDASENQENLGGQSNGALNQDDAGLIDESLPGVSKKKFLMSVDDNEVVPTLDDKYTTAIPAMDEAEDKRDEATIKRESFLTIYKEKAGDKETTADEPDLSSGVRFKRDEAEDEESGFELKTSLTGGKKPLI